MSSLTNLRAVVCLLRQSPLTGDTDLIWGRTLKVLAGSVCWVRLPNTSEGSFIETVMESVSVHVYVCFYISFKVKTQWWGFFGINILLKMFNTVPGTE